VQAIQWDGTNGDTILTNFGSYIASYPDAGHGDGSLLVTTNEGNSFLLRIGDWIHLNVLNKLEVTEKVAMYKKYNYVSG